MIGASAFVRPALLRAITFTVALPVASIEPLITLSNARRPLSGSGIHGWPKRCEVTGLNSRPAAVALWPAYPVLN